MCRLPVKDMAPGCTVGRRSDGGCSLIFWANKGNLESWNLCGCYLDTYRHLNLVADQVNFKYMPVKKLFSNRLRNRTKSSKMLTRPKNFPDLNRNQLWDVWPMEAPPRNLVKWTVLLMSWRQKCCFRRIDSSEIIFELKTDLHNVKPGQFINH